MNPLVLFLGILMFSFILTSVLIVPFINLLYKMKFQRLSQITRDTLGKLTPVFNQFHQHKAGIPIGCGLLIIMVVSCLYAISLPILSNLGIAITSIYQDINAEVNILFFTFLSFGLLGLYDDIKKFFGVKKNGFFGLRMHQKLLLQAILAIIIACMMYFSLHVSFIYIPLFRQTLQIGPWFIPYAAFVIVAFANAVNFTDGLDGLAGGLLMISLFGLWILSASIVDIPLSIFLALWIGAIISFLYFNIFPARILMGDVGALAFGATLAVVGLLLGKVIALTIIGFIFVVEITSCSIQLIGKIVFKKKIFPAAPIHLSLQKYGWEEPKIVQRAWLVQIMLTIFGVWLALM